MIDVAAGGAKRVADLIAARFLEIGDGYRAKNSELDSEGLPFARAGNIATGFRFHDVDRFPERNLAVVGSKVSRPGDVVFTSKGTVGRFALVKDHTPRFVYSPQLCYWRSLQPESIDPAYLYYWMHGPEFQQQIHGMKSQTDMADYVSLGDQRRMFISLPEIEQQHAIAHILGTIDDKIELNRRTTQTLDALARALFTSWFVAFDPVRANAEGRPPAGMDAATAALFPAEFIETKSEGGLIPSGWRAETLSAVAVLNPARPLRKGDPAPYLDMANVPTAGPRAVEWIDRPYGSGTRFRNGDTLMARITPCLENGKTALVDFLEDGQTGWGSTEFIVLHPRPPLPSAWGYCLARHSPFREFAIRAMSGTSGRQRVSAEAVGRYGVVVPPEAVAKRFADLAQPLFDGIKQRDEESRTLAAMRDTLLPRLLSGELRVPAAERLLAPEPV